MEDVFTAMFFSCSFNLSLYSHTAMSWCKRESNGNCWCASNFEKTKKNPQKRASFCYSKHVSRSWSTAHKLMLSIWYIRSHVILIIMIEFYPRNRWTEEKNTHTHGKRNVLCYNLLLNVRHVRMTTTVWWYALRRLMFAMLSLLLIRSFLVCRVSNFNMISTTSHTNKIKKATVTCFVSS